MYIVPEILQKYITTIQGDILCVFENTLVYRARICFKYYTPNAAFRFSQSKAKYWGLSFIIFLLILVNSKWLLYGIWKVKFNNLPSSLMQIQLPLGNKPEQNCKTKNIILIINAYCKP